jgi:hypothetical protein
VGERFGIAAILNSFAASKITQQQHASILIALGFHGRFFAFFRSAFYAHFAHQTAKCRQEHMQQPTVWPSCCIAACAAPNGGGSYGALQDSKRL